ncbi:MAG: type II secretion system F family protein [Lentisphaeria bacterium]
MAQSSGNKTGADGNVRKQKTKIRGVRKIKNTELCPFTQKLAAMLDAGLPLVQCMEALSDQTDNPEFRKIVVDIKERIEGGDSFAEALRHYHELFGDLYVNMIQAGEIGGGLSEVTARLASYLEASVALKRKVKSALTYPVIVMILSGVLTIAMLVFIVPTFAEIYKDFDAELPKPTKVLVKISDIVRGQAVYVMIFFALLWYVIHRIKKTDQGTYMFDQFVLKMPVAGQLLEKIALARMARTFASLVRSGVPILKTLEIVSQATGNRYIGRALETCGGEIEGGANIAASLKNTNQFPPMVIHMIAAGEKTGNIDGMLEKVADFYEDEVTNALESLSSMIEPLLMAFLGVVIGGIVICMFLPIFKMNEIVQ